MRKMHDAYLSPDFESRYMSWEETYEMERQGEQMRRAHERRVSNDEDA